MTAQGSPSWLYRALGGSALFVTLCTACNRTRLENVVQESGAEAASAAASATDSGPATAPLADWQGSYKSVSGELYIPADWKNVRWNVKESSSLGLGDGAMMFTIDSATGRVRGTLEGVLGPAIIDGFCSDGRLTATIVRKDPTDKGFMGTLIGSITSGRAEGTLHVSLAEANAIRTATFTMSPASARVPPH